MIEALAEGGIEAEQRVIHLESELVKALGDTGPDIVFNALSVADHEPKALRGIQRVLQGKGYATIGTELDALTLINTRSALQGKWRGAGISTPSSFHGHTEPDHPLVSLDGVNRPLASPCLVGPDAGCEDRDSNLFVIAETDSELRETMLSLSKKFDTFFIEEFFGKKKGTRFYSVVVVGNSDRAILLPSEVLLENGTLLETVTDRDIECGRAAIVALEDDTLKDELMRFAGAAFRTAGVKDFGRLELVMSGKRFYALRIKAQPEVPDLIFDACAAIGGLNSKQITVAMFIAGFARLFIERKASIAIPSRLMTLLPQPYFSILYG